MPFLNIKNDVGYPFNLIDAVFGREVEWYDDADHMEGLEHALETLSDREQKVIQKRYQELKTLEETGRDFNVTRERIRQVEAHAVRKLRHPARQRFILHGFHGGAELEELKGKAKELDEREKLIEKREKTLDELIERCKPKFEMLNVTIESPVEDIEDAVRNSLKVDDMDLSVRSYNCLRRANINTALDLINLCESDKYLELLRVRNLGRKSLTEVLERLYELTGRDFREKYDIYIA